MRMRRSRSRISSASWKSFEKRVVMKRCPTCNQTYAEDWLTFCTSDGTPLTEAERSTGAPPPTIVMPPPTVTASQDERPTMRMPSDPFSGGPVSWPQQQQPMAPVWQPPPPPPAYFRRLDQNLAVTSLVLGLVSVTAGWCCSFGILTSPVAIGVGIFALVQIKNKPTQYTGKGMAIGGIVTGAIYLVGTMLFVLLYGLAFLARGVN